MFRKVFRLDWNNIFDSIWFPQNQKYSFLWLVKFVLLIFYFPLSLHWHSTHKRCIGFVYSKSLVSHTRHKKKDKTHTHSLVVLSKQRIASHLLWDIFVLNGNWSILRREGGFKWNKIIKVDHLMGFVVLTLHYLCSWASIYKPIIVLNYYYPILPMA